MYEIREILPEELPLVPSAEGPRPAELQDLMNLGLFPAADNLYVCVGAFADGRGQYKSTRQLPGRSCCSGYLEQRTRALEPRVRQKFLRARVLRHRDPEQSLRHLVNDNEDPERLRAGVPVLRGSSRPANQAKALAALEAARAMAEGEDPEAVEVSVAEEDVQDGDVVIEDLMVPMKFAGEPDR